MKTDAPSAPSTLRLVAVRDRDAAQKFALGATGLLASALALFVISRPSLEALRFGPLECPFHAVTGLECPACGGTRAFWHLAHGNFLAALRMNAAMPFMVLGLFSSYLVWARSVLRGRAYQVSWLVAPLSILLAVVWGVFRNVWLPL